MKPTVCTIFLLLSLNLFSQKIDWTNAPLNPVAEFYTLNHFNLNGPVMEANSTTFDLKFLFLYFNENGDLIQKITSQSGGSFKELFEYEYAGKGILKSKKQSSINSKDEITPTAEYIYSYNSNGLISLVKNLSNNGTTTYSYDSNNNLIASVMINSEGISNEKTEYKYNSSNQIISENNIRSGKSYSIKFEYSKNDNSNLHISLYSYKDELLLKQEPPYAISSLERQTVIPIYNNPQQYEFQKDGHEAYKKEFVKVSVDQYNNLRNTHGIKMDLDLNTVDVTYHYNIVSKIEETKTNTTTNTNTTTTANNCISGNCNDGYGTLKVTGATLTGFFVNRVASGYMNVDHDAGDSYVGNYRNGQRDGYGIYSWKNSGTLYSGQWKAGVQHGYGYQIKSSVISEAGYYENGTLVRNMLTQDYKDGVFKGSCKGNCSNGFGQYKFTNGDWFIGFFENNKTAHMGAYTWTSGEAYLGEFLNGKLSGSGNLSKVDGTSFSGNYSNGVRNGWGLETDVTGKETRIGFWTNDIITTDITSSITIDASNASGNMSSDTKEISNTKSDCLSGNCNDGFGSIKTALSTITGFFTNGKANGYAKETYDDGTGYYQGAFKNGFRDGFGVYYWISSGQYFVGQWKDGKYHGYGYVYKGVDVLQAGYYENGKQTTNLLTQNYLDSVLVDNCIGDCNNGFGSYKYASGDIYIGFFSNNMKSNVGSYSWKTGNFYMGEYMNNKANGQGIEYYSSAESLYYGEFINAKRQGLGAYLSISDEIKSKGYWENGELKTSM